ncbi:DUF4097 family beta strand repeat-containing protein [Paenibacillus sp. YYML68]|uniref:DUF4097 family beta strand repeat-containing protein n=1 Tax=Paenibacillus sp. YYML68 TaxID=2909250 RepID=UPI0024924D5D|nr:DUF4097 family beta strand repeat-containing protein [Paenibacillus sp. YYML68]
MVKKIGIGTILIAAGVALGLYSLNPQHEGASGMFMGTEDIQIRQTVDVGAHSMLKLELTSTDVELLPSSGSEIEFELHGKGSSRYVKQVKLEVEPKGSTLYATVERPSGTSFGSSLELTLTARIPEKQWESIIVRTESGDMMLSELQAQAIELQTSSGDIEVEQFVAEKLSFRTNSGDVAIEGAEASRVKGETSSGNVELELEQLTQDVELNTMSGNVSVMVEAEPASLSLDFEGSSGEGEVDWPSMSHFERSENGNQLRGTVGDGAAKLKVRTKSGDFRFGRS